VELKQPALMPDVRSATNLQVVRIAPPDRQAIALTPNRQHVWDSLFARMVVSLLAFLLPFFAIVWLIPGDLGHWGIAVLASALLIGIIAVVARMTIRPVIALSRAAARVESGDLSVRVVPAGSGEMRVLGQQFNAMLERLASMSARLRGEVAESATRLSAVAEQLAGATMAQTTAATESSSSMEELARGAVAIADIADGVASQADAVRIKIAVAQTEVAEAGQGVHALTQKVGEIESILVLIDDIADQTNLLALNAAIEAARAGEAGRGFAVVASEVKSLASQTAKATDDISEQIADMQKVAGDAIEAIKGIGGIIGEVNEVATAIAAAVEEQGAATQEITRSTQQAAQGTKNVSDNIIGVSAGADAAGAAAQNVKTASEMLGAQTEQLRGQVDAFLGKIRAA